MTSPYLPDWTDKPTGRPDESVVQVQGTGLYVDFDRRFDRVLIHRGELLSDERGESLIMTHAEFAELVDQARKLRGRATPRWWNSHQQTGQPDV